MDYKKYKKEDSATYCLGGFPCIELLNHKPHSVKEIILHDKASKSKELENIKKIAKEHKIKISTNSKLIEKISGKQNIYIMAVLNKYSQEADHTQNQVLLVNPSDMGNLGTIMRVMLGFDYKNLSIIKPCIDIFDPKVIRASMGAIFKLNIQLFDTFEDFMKINHNHMYPFMLQSNEKLQDLQMRTYPHTLIFGNESHGLDDIFLNYGTPLIIKHSHEIDSLNLSMSVGIALYEFTKK